MEKIHFSVWLNQTESVRFDKGDLNEWNLMKFYLEIMPFFLYFRWELRANYGAKWQIPNIIDKIFGTLNTVSYWICDKKNRTTRNFVSMKLI